MRLLGTKVYSTVQVARLIGISSNTLHRWIREKRVKAPPIQSLLDMQAVRVWTEEDVKELMKFKSEHFWGRGGRKKRRKRNK